jgi:hypothetical protein
MRRGHLGLCASQLSDRKATASSSSSGCSPDCVCNLREQGLISQLSSSSSSSSGFFL